MKAFTAHTKNGKPKWNGVLGQISATSEFIPEKIPYI